MLSLVFPSFPQAVSHPWLGLLLVREEEPAYSKCSATLVLTPHSSLLTPHSLIQ